MMYCDKLEKEFIKRTLELLKLQSEVEYEDTLFVNLCIGLLIIPREAYKDRFEQIKNEYINYDEWGICEDNIEIIKPNNEKSIDSVVRHIRNSISHGHFHFKSEDNKNITHIFLEDMLNDKKTFEATFPIGDFKEFVVKIANYALDNFAK